ncbi:MAG: oligoendopeptidase F [Anaerolineales bacterium]|nr:oligoendopeptidase F [Anaerolineales bacterium]MCB8950939.1 oligoendopeptidase F [Ardenticatenales bacterium]
MSTKLPERNEVPVAYTWDVESIFPTPADWAAAVEEVKAALPNLAAFQGRLAESAAVMADWMAAYEDVVAQAYRVFVYAGMNTSVNAADQTASAQSARARELVGQVATITAFAEPEMLQIGFDTLRDWVAAEQRLSIYGHYFDKLARRAPHVRSAEVEALLGQVSDFAGTAAATHGILVNTDLAYAPATDSEGETHPVAQSTIGGLITDPDRDKRRNAWINYADAHLAYKNTMANCLSAGIKRDVFYARARHYPSSLAASMSAYNVPTEVFHNTINTFKANLPTWHRYWRVRRQALGYDTLHEWDIKAPLTQQKPHVPFSQAIDWISAGMQPLGDEYVRILRRGALQDRWVDVYPNQGKRMGAYSTGAPGTHPFIFMSYVDDLFSMSTLAHELGHSMHSYFSRENQPLVYARYTLFEAEVASNFNQAMTRGYLMENSTDPAFRIAVIEEAMSNFHRYFFIMPTLARFELEIHERAERGEPFTADDLINLMADLFAEGYGDELQMDRERTGITWAMFATHLYSNFYVYQYTTGISAAHALAERILRHEPNAVDNYLAFLKSGGSRYPLDSLRLAGVDMLSPEPVEQTFKVLGRMVDMLEDLLGVS